MSDVHDIFVKAFELGLHRHYANTVVCPDLELEGRHELADRVRIRAQMIVERKNGYGPQNKRICLVPVNVTGLGGWLRPYKIRNRTPDRFVMILPQSAELVYRRLFRETFGERFTWSSAFWPPAKPLPHLPHIAVMNNGRVL